MEWTTPRSHFRLRFYNTWTASGLDKNISTHCWRKIYAWPKTMGPWTKKKVKQFFPQVDADSKLTHSTKLLLLWSAPSLELTNWLKVFPVWCTRRLKVKGIYRFYQKVNNGSGDLTVTTFGYRKWTMIVFWNRTLIDNGIESPQNAHFLLLQR